MKLHRRAADVWAVVDIAGRSHDGHGDPGELAPHLRPGTFAPSYLPQSYLLQPYLLQPYLPQPYLPPGLAFDPEEAAGEVQTPLLGKVASTLKVGDRVWFRHTKAGELCERFDTLHLISGSEVVRSVPTYRGEGRTFL